VAGKPGDFAGHYPQGSGTPQCRPFVLAGFGWDYAGVITDWKGGALDSTLAGIKLYLDPGSAQHESATYSQVLGDRDYSSDLPAMQQLNPKVAQIFVDFE